MLLVDILPLSILDSIPNMDSDTWLDLYQSKLVSDRTH